MFDSFFLIQIFVADYNFKKSYSDMNAKGNIKQKAIACMLMPRTKCPHAITNSLL